MNALRRLVARLRRRESLDPQLAALGAICRHPAAHRRNTPGRGTR